MDIPKNHPYFSSGAGAYASPAGVRAADKVAGRDARQCGSCGKPNTIACSLKVCTKCRSAWYCDRECQKKDFARHKKECAGLAQAAATGPSVAKR
ncbi:hypothetical protein TSOC_000004 [Tetrabaena socialis]|uniref:MYND-type domain-containing protein n=1 Tax=Tetrabaena socialis TaxID=47790 RepID=A0A2J8A7B3_9CHLO|nr:hypothetical protein TSOC_005093 [Tetrabaena socialis]PNH13008.1 hypothetical protein TSOC_000004 [Tetrabaena socialis]|eukprot:PNH08395.1 hypothetical protein TSOC_005093 [Tetrabaena socialis]